MFGPLSGQNQSSRMAETQDGSAQKVEVSLTIDDNHDARHVTQANMRFDDAPERFQKGHPEDHFPGASGVLFEQAMAQTRMAICLCDPKLDDMPIVFANRAFRQLTGYDEEEIIGRNCRFLQGPDSDPEVVERIRQAIKTEEVVIVEIRNYRKDGSSFWNALHLGPIYNNEGELMYFFGSQWDVSDVRAARAEEQYARTLARELSHRMKNMFSVISGIVNVTGRMRGVPAEAAEINERIQALGRAYATTVDDPQSGSVQIGEAIRAVLAPYLDSGQRIELKGNGARMPFGTISVVGLMLHEFAANAIKYGAWSNDSGAVEVDWHLDDDTKALALTWKESGGPEIDPSDITPGVGTKVIDRLLRPGIGAIERDWQPEGLSITVTLPVGKKA